MTDWQPRDLTLDLGFLGNTRMDITIYEDGVNADRMGIDFVKRPIQSTGVKTLALHLAPGGGWVAVARPLLQKASKETSR